jgi:hypothetical protein
LAWYYIRTQISEKIEGTNCNNGKLSESILSFQMQTMLSTIQSQIGDTLPCSHCHGAKPLAYFAKSLAKYFKDGTLTKIPKSCDKMGEINRRNNKANNDVNNVKKSIERLNNIAPIDPEAHFAKLQDLYDKLDLACKARVESRASRS